MEKTRLGRTNLLVTRLGWGGIPIQRADEREAVSVIKAVVDMESISWTRPEVIRTASNGLG